MRVKGWYGVNEGEVRGEKEVRRNREIEREIESLYFCELTSERSVSELCVREDCCQGSSLQFRRFLSQDILLGSIQNAARCCYKSVVPH